MRDDEDCDEEDDSEEGFDGGECPTIASLDVDVFMVAGGVVVFSSGEDAGEYNFLQYFTPP